MDKLAVLIEIERLAREAGALILQVYATDFAVLGKADASPVTEADELAERCIVAGLQALAPGVPIVAEEAASRGESPAAAARFWLVDPLDGTREFIARNGEFTVNIALVEGGRPVLGVVLAPALPQGPVLYLGVAGQGAWRAAWAPRAPGDAWGFAPAFPPGQGAPWQPIHARAAPPAGITVVGSRSHGDDQAMQTFLASRSGSPPVADRRGIGSSLKFCLLAEGQADLYPRLGRTMEWDTAAGHAVLQAAGGRVLTLQAEPLSYGKPGFENPHFVAEGIA